MLCAIWRILWWWPTSVHDIQTGNVVQQQSMESTMLGIVPEAAPSRTSGHTGIEKALSAALDWALHIMVLFEIITEWYAKKVVKRLHCYHLGISECKESWKAWHSKVSSYEKAAVKCLETKNFWKSKWLWKSKRAQVRVSYTGSGWLRSWRGKLKCIHEKGRWNFKGRRNRS